MKNHSLILLPTLFILFSCSKDEEEAVCPDPPKIIGGVIWDDTIYSSSNNGLRYILMEEFTGHKNRNAPMASKEVARLKDEYGNRLIHIAIHMTDAFASSGAPAGAPDGSYENDHRAPEAPTYLDEFNVQAIPTGLVSRNLSDPLNLVRWQGEIDNILSNPGSTVANLTLISNFDDSTKSYRIQTVIEWLTEYQGGLKLQLQLVEDHITDWQLDGTQNPEHVENYDHRRMYRGSINGFWGRQLSYNAIVNQKDTFVYTEAFDPGNVGYNIDNVSIVAFLYKDPSEGYEVMQVNEVRLK